MINKDNFLLWENARKNFYHLRISNNGNFRVTKDFCIDHRMNNFKSFDFYLHKTKSNQFLLSFFSASQGQYKTQWQSGSVGGSLYNVIKDNPKLVGYYKLKEVEEESGQLMMLFERIKYENGKRNQAEG